MRNPTGFYSSKPHELLVTTPWNGFATSVFEYCGGDGAGQEPIGHSNYNALQVNFNRRERWGLTFMAPYTYSKFLDDVGGPEEWGSINSGFGGIGSIRNFYDLGAEWGVDSTDIPQSVVLNYVYEIPVGRGKKYGSGMNAVENAVAGGWQISGISNSRQDSLWALGTAAPISIACGAAISTRRWCRDSMLKLARARTVIR